MAREVKTALPNSALKIKFKNIFADFIFLIVLFGLPLKLSFELEEYLKNNFCFFAYPFWSHLTRFLKLIFNIFYVALSQTVQPVSTLRLFCNISLFHSALWFFLKTRLRVRNSSFNIIFAPLLMTLDVIR